MPRFQNTLTGTVVDVSAATGKLLGAEYEPASDESAAKAKTSKAAQAKAAADDAAKAAADAAK